LLKKANETSLFSSDSHSSNHLFLVGVEETDSLLHVNYLQKKKG